MRLWGTQAKGFTRNVSLTDTTEYPYRGDLGVGKEKHAIGAESHHKRLLLLRSKHSHDFLGFGARVLAEGVHRIMKSCALGQMLVDVGSELCFLRVVQFQN